MKFRDIVITATCLGGLAYTIVWMENRNPEILQGGFYAVDGDSLQIDGKRMRLQGIDAPEYSQMCNRDGKSWACGRASRNALRRMITGKTVICKGKSEDRYDRLLVLCTADKVEINAAMVRNGWAVNYGGYSAEQLSAERKKLGIWNSQFEVPEEWRRAQRGSASASAAQSGVLDRLKSWFSSVPSDDD